MQDRKSSLTYLCLQSKHHPLTQLFPVKVCGPTQAEAFLQKEKTKGFDCTKDFEKYRAQIQY